MTDDYYVDIWFEVDDPYLDIQAISTDLRRNGWVILTHSGKEADYGIKRGTVDGKNVAYVYGVAIYEKDRDHNGITRTTEGREILDRLNRGDYYTPRPSNEGEQRRLSEYREAENEERFDRITGKSKRYADHMTGETISYREYAKRSGKAWAIKSQKKKH